METRIIEFGAVSSGILAALTGGGYEVDTCGTSDSRFKQALRRPQNLDAIALAENSASKALGIVTPIRSLDKVPLILFQDKTQTCDPSLFDLIVPEHAPLPNLLKKVAALIERSRALRAEAQMSRERFHSLLRTAVSLREDLVRAGVELQHTNGLRLKPSLTERVSIPRVLVVDDHAGWRETLSSMLKSYADCGLLCEAKDGIEAVQRATELKPTLILLDLNLPRQDGIEAARQVMQFTPDSTILFVSMADDADVVSIALSTGAKGYLLKGDVGKELRSAIEAVLQGKQYLSPGLRRRHSTTIN